MLTEEQWHEERKRGIGGSECSAVIGFNPYMSNVALWEIKTGRKEQPDISNKDCVRFGKENESIIINRFREKYGDRYDVSHRDYDIRISKNFNFLFGSLDGELLDRETGEEGILEIKTSMLNKYNRNKWEGNALPHNYYCQLLHYLLVTNYSYALVYVQFRDFKDNITGYRLYRFESKDKQKDMDNLRKAEIYFWNYNVLRDIKPNPINQMKKAG